MELAVTTPGYDNIVVSQAVRGKWIYKVTALDVPFRNFPYVVVASPQSTWSSSRPANDIEGTSIEIVFTDEPTTSVDDIEIVFTDGPKTKPQEDEADELDIVLHDT